MGFIRLQRLDTKWEPFQWRWREVDGFEKHGIIKFLENEKKRQCSHLECVLLFTGGHSYGENWMQEDLRGLSSAQNAVRFAACLCVGRHLYGRTAKLQHCVLPKSLCWSDSAHDHFMTGISRNPKWVIKNAKPVFSIQTIPPGDVSSLGPGAFAH